MLSLGLECVQCVSVLSLHRSSSMCVCVQCLVNVLSVRLWVVMCGRCVNVFQCVQRGVMVFQGVSLFSCAQKWCVVSLGVSRCSMLVRAFNVVQCVEYLQGCSIWYNVCVCQCVAVSANVFQYVHSAFVCV